MHLSKILQKWEVGLILKAGCYVSCYAVTSSADLVVQFQMHLFEARS